MRQPNRLSRRQFLAKAGAAISAPFLVPSGAFAAAGRTGANERLTIGMIGVGGMGKGHLRNMIKFRQAGLVNIAAVCDVDENRLAAAVELAGAAVEPYRDYRYILQRKDIDAVLIATPDHWHAVQAVHACEAGKHVFVEKPTSVTIEEGKAMVAAARKYKRVVQVGSQARSAKPAHDACKYIRNDMIGRVRKVTCWHRCPPQASDTGPDTTPPANLDWDMWLGPMRWRPHNTAYYPGRFRQIMDSGGGMIRDRGAHVFSIIRWCLDADRQAPVTVEAAGMPPTKGIYDCPVQMEVVYTFKNPDWQVIWAQPGERHTNYPDKNKDFGLVFWGDSDSLIVDRDGTRYEAAEKARNFKIPAGGKQVYSMGKYEDYNMNHKADWFAAIKTGTKPCMDVEAGHGAAVMCILGNLSYLLGRKLRWDAKKQRVIGDRQANRLLSTPQRHPYHL
ncbi:MAG: Gfo/Idh/MocA family protein [Planctomycetota bacterium]|jgi:predicted dehydrogenase